MHLLFIPKHRIKFTVGKFIYLFIYIYTLMLKQQRQMPDSRSCQQLQLSISMLDSLLNKIRHPNNALNGRQSEKIGISCADASPKLLLSQRVSTENRLVRPIFLHASKR
jgi:hypothetical protein